MISVDHISARVRSQLRRRLLETSAGGQEGSVVFGWPSAAAISVLCRLTILAVLVLGFITHRVVIS